MNETKLTELVPAFLEETGAILKDSTKAVKQRVLNNICLFLEKEGITTHEQLTADSIHRYFNTFTGRESTRSMNMFIVRTFANWLYQKGLISFSGSMLYPVIRSNKREYLPTRYDAAEVDKVIKSVDMNSSLGSRNKCMILLAAETGLRRSDIVNLRISNINFANNSLSGVQKKTGEPYCVPMSEGLRYHLANYLKNHRPVKELELDDYVFLNTKTLQPLDASVVTATVSDHFAKAGINIEGKRHGPHALRSSAATNLQESGTPLHVISAVLGHHGSASLIAYLATDIPHLRMMALEVPAV